MELGTLYRIAEKHRIGVFSFPMSDASAMCLRLGEDDFAVALNPARIGTETAEKTALAHELGHCATGAFYDVATPVATRGKCERRADEWSVRKLVPKSALKKALREGSTEAWQLAEHFGVDEKLIGRALAYYSFRPDATSGG